ncbi:MAG: RagB/SusD family nutrient uptake outer membrane protein [Capnocytophaga sp.]|jgi:ragB/susD domain protein|uniref:RagB/SusD family nutrient uptake outer membrane protein n=1 Tax=Capnocytophaga TaxID=1016 RepID=UPI00222EBFEC|nr:MULTISPECIES: RagB/SusD family nutrient uptake outer membrane protein [Capnocytophaga]MDU6660060.1 RagB/SusD family nutrient uptake outer membrane protein [Capnocytophaga sp.]UZD39145.1 RagB/SusD family nutrient uptake outer membrane protein [Capnocytophaga ochracea]
MKKYIKHSIFGVILALSLSACMKDLDQEPIDPDSFTEKDVFKNATEAKGALAKIYASLSLTGQKGPSGDGDIAGADEGSTGYTRMQFYLQVASTDEAIIRWSDAGVPDFHNMSWTPANTFNNAYYNRLGQQIAFANSFIDNAQALASDPEVAYYIAEARFIRAYAYYNVIDAFGKAPLVTSSKADLKPAQNTRAELFNFVESELKDLEGKLKAARANEYGRVDVVAAQALLARLYLNAKVYIGQDKYTDCITYAKKVIASSYSLNTTDANNNGTAYDELFLADNNSNGAQNEFIFLASFDGLNTKTYGGTAFIIHGATGGNMNASSLGINDGWSGLTAPKEFVNKFEVSARNSNNEPTAWKDKRAMFYTDGQTYENTDLKDFTKSGYAITKFKNITSTGAAGKDPEKKFPDTDLPLIRLAEVYLTYAEAVLRGGTGGDRATALGYINQLRSRAYGNASGNIADSNLTLDFILDERARELYWEGLRRTDLIRYGKFTGGAYLWSFKGGAASGVAVPDYRNLYPIPQDARTANDNLTQNTGY